VSPRELLPSWKRSSVSIDSPSPPISFDYSLTISPIFHSASRALCAGGSYASMLASERCESCPSGFSCPSGSVSPVKCADGFFSLGAATECTLCSAGSFCVDGIESICFPGFASFAGQRACSPCAAGSACVGGVSSLCATASYSGPQQSFCTVCPSGSYSSAPGTAMCSAW
jgi:hypothetical protein